MAPSFKTHRRGRPSLKSKSKLPRYAGMKTQIQQKRNENKSNYTLKVYRYGFKLMERVCPRLMKKNSIKPFGEYDKNNVHAGKIWGHPAECKMTNRLARDIMFKCIQSRVLTYDQLRAIRKSLAYTKELTGGKAGENWKGVAVAWDTMNRQDLPSKFRNLLPQKIPTPHQLKKAWTTDYNRQWPLGKYCVGNLAAFDTFVIGVRANTDTTRIKKATVHEMNTEEGWCCSKYKGGRAKLGNGKYRDWWVWRVCFCKGKKHKSPPEDQIATLDINGTPEEDLEWDPTCPLACKQFINQYAVVEDRNYPKWLKRINKFGKSNVSNIVDFANEWMELQGAGTPGGYDHNSGRKSLARWLDHLNISYRWSFEISGDLEKVWRSNYQPTLQKSGYKKRTQSRDPNEATQALRRFAKWIGRGCERKLKYKLDVNSRLTYHLLKSLGKKDLADQILMGMPVDDEDEEDLNGEEEEGEMQEPPTED